MVVILDGLYGVFFVQLPLFLWDFSWYKLFHIEYKYTNAVICIIQYSEQT